MDNIKINEILNNSIRNLNINSSVYKSKAKEQSLAEFLADNTDLSPEEILEECINNEDVFTVLVEATGPQQARPVPVISATGPDGKPRFWVFNNLNTKYPGHMTLLTNFLKGLEAKDAKIVQLNDPARKLMTAQNSTPVTIPQNAAQQKLMTSLKGLSNTINTILQHEKDPTYMSPEQINSIYKNIAGETNQIAASSNDAKASEQQQVATASTQANQSLQNTAGDNKIGAQAIGQPTPMPQESDGYKGADQLAPVPEPGHSAPQPTQQTTPVGTQEAPATKAEMENPFSPRVKEYFQKHPKALEHPAFAKYKEAYDQVNQEIAKNTKPEIPGPGGTMKSEINYDNRGLGVQNNGEPVPQERPIEYNPKATASFTPGRPVGNTQLGAQDAFTHNTIAPGAVPSKSPVGGPDEGTSTAPLKDQSLGTELESGAPSARFKVNLKKPQPQNR